MCRAGRRARCRGRRSGLRLAGCRRRGLIRRCGRGCARSGRRRLATRREARAWRGRRRTRPCCSGCENSEGGAEIRLAIRVAVCQAVDDASNGIHTGVGAALIGFLAELVADPVTDGGAKRVREVFEQFGRGGKVNGVVGVDSAVGGGGGGVVAAACDLNKATSAKTPAVS